MPFLTSVQHFGQFLAWTTKFGLRQTRYILLDDKTFRPEDEINVEGKVVVITGGNRGMGKVTAMELAKRKTITVLGCKNMITGLSTVEEIKAETGNQNVEAIYLDLSDMDKVETFALEVARKYPKIKLLINNAGVGGAHGEWAKQRTREGFQIHVAVNHLGPFLLTNLLLENLRREVNSRIVTISSRSQIFSQLNLDDIMMEKSGFGFLNGLPYCNTKFANALFMKELGERLKGTGVKTYALCPALVNTDMLNSPTIIPPNRILAGLHKITVKVNAFPTKMAVSQFVLFCALHKKIENETGFMYIFNRPFKDANKRLTPALRIKLWNLSEQLVSLDSRMERFVGLGLEMENV